LPDGHSREHAIDEMRGAVRHAPASAARAHRTPSARERDEQIVPTRVAVRPNEAMGEHAAAHMRAQLLST